MTIQRTEYKFGRPTSKDGLLWTTSLRLGKDHPRGIVEVAGQCRVLDSDGLVMHHYREVRSDTVSAKLIDLYSATSRQYDSHVLELTTPKGWVPQNIWLHVITSNEDPSLSRGELYCDFRIELPEEERAPTKNLESMTDRSTVQTTQIEGWHCKYNIMASGPLFQLPDDYRPELSSRPILTGKVVLESGKVLDKEATQTILDSIKVNPSINVISRRFSVSLVMPDKYQLRPMTSTASLVRLSDQGAYRLVLTCDFTLTSPNPYQHTCAHHDRHVEATKVTKSQEDTAVESPSDPTLFDTLFHSCKFVTWESSTEHSIELELPYEYHTHRIAIVTTQDPKDQSYVHPNGQLSPSLTKRNEYLLRLVTVPGVVISDVRHRLDQEDNILIQVDIHRPQDTETLSVNPEPLTPSDNSPKPGQTDGTVVHQSPWTPKQLVKEIYENGERVVGEILQSTNNYFTWLVREELATDPNIKCVLESPVPENLMHKLYVTLTDAGYVVEIDNEKLNFTIELPSVE